MAVAAREMAYPGPRLVSKAGKVDDGERKKYRTEIPNVVDDADLSVYAFRLYAHIKRVAGENGQCWEGSQTLAKACKMSVGKVSAAKQELAEAGLIAVDPGEWKKGKADTITVVDVWDLNYRTFSPHEKVDEKHPETFSCGEGTFSPHERTFSPHEPKKEPIKKELDKKDDDLGAHTPADESNEQTDLDHKHDKQPVHDFFAERFGEASGKERIALDKAATLTDDLQLMYDLIEEIYKRTKSGSSIAYPAAYFLGTLPSRLAAKETTNGRTAQRSDHSGRRNQGTRPQAPAKRNTQGGTDYNALLNWPTGDT